jgi:uncharacterized protein YndB with AHSA1/START domain
MFKWLFGGGGKKDAGEEAGGTAELLVVSRKVPAPIDKAFARFIDEFGAWWPKSYTLAGDNLAEIRIDPRIGGRAIERDKNGVETQWGTVLSFFRPQHLVLAWQIAPDRTVVPNESNASRVDVRFVEAGPDATEVVVVHRDFPRHGDGWEKYRKDMGAGEGWPSIMDRYAASFGARS